MYEQHGGIGGSNAPYAPHTHQTRQLPPTMLSADCLGNISCSPTCSAWQHQLLLWLSPENRWSEALYGLTAIAVSEVERRVRPQPEDQVADGRLYKSPGVDELQQVACPCEKPCALNESVAVKWDDAAVEDRKKDSPRVGRP